MMRVNLESKANWRGGSVRGGAAADHQWGGAEMTRWTAA